MRQLSFLFLAACLCISVVGCGGDAATTDAPATPAADDGSAAAGSEAKEDAAAGSEAKEEATEEAAAE